MDHERVIPLDDIAPDTVEYLVQGGYEMMEDNADEFDQLIQSA